MKAYSTLSILLIALMGMLTACSPGPTSNDPLEQNNEEVLNRGAGKDHWWNKLPRSDWNRFEKILTDQDWFEVYRISRGVYAIYEPGQFEEVISYLILGEEEALLFDTGLGIGDIRKVVEHLTDLPVTLLNSHTHYDHIGGNYQFDSLERTLGVDLPFTQEHSRGLVHTDVSFAVAKGWIWKSLPPGVDLEKYRIRPYHITRFVEDGTVINLGGRSLEVLLTPGHAPDAVCLLDRQNRLLFTGDTFYLAPLYAHLEGSDIEAYAHSAARLADLVGEVDQLVTSHNVPLADSRYLLQLKAAFESIRHGSDTYVVSDGNREYSFADFSIIVPAGQSAHEPPL